MTCPDVKKVQQKAVELAQNDYYVVVVGKSEHPEVIGIRANALKYTDKVFVASTVNELKSIEKDLKFQKKIGVVVQTTQRISNLSYIVEYLTGIAKELRVFNTICANTSMRQNEAKELAQHSDLMIVVGSKNSANTTHLAQILKDITETIHIENEYELDNYKDLIKSKQNISITAGASTPQDIIENVISKLEKGE